jgi:hypothetical protein
LEQEGGEGAASTLRRHFFNKAGTDFRMTRKIGMTANDLAALPARALAIGALAIGAFAVGALAIGALALGAVAIGRLAIGRSKINRLEIDELVVRKLQVTDSLETPADRDTRSR